MMTRLNYEDILHIYKLISLDHSAIEISQTLHVNPSSIYRLIKDNKVSQQISKNKKVRSYPFKNCIHLYECKLHMKSCIEPCPRYKKYICPKLRKFPFICNFCPDKSKCVKEQYYFYPDEVYLKRQHRLIHSRKHIRLKTRAFNKFDCWVSPLIQEGKSIEVLYHAYPDAFPVCTSTLRRWINEGYLMAKPIDLRRAVKFKIKKQYQFKRSYSKDPLFKYTHTYSYFKKYIKRHPRASIMEFDTVHGLASEKTKIFTLYHRQSHLQIGIRLDKLTETEVNKKLRNIQTLLGKDYRSLFHVILADNGLEFDGLMKNSIDEKTGQILSHVFYTRPYNSGDKGGCEKNHTLFRYFIPKGKPLSPYSQHDLNLMFSHINSYPRESLSWQSPIDVFKKYFPASILTKLDIQKVDVIDINFKIKTNKF